MKKYLILAFVALGLGSCFFAKAQNDKPFVHCLVLDKTMSMTGHGGDNIWADVQDYCYNWVDGIKIPSTVVFFTYARDLEGPEVFEVKSDSDKQKVKDAVRNVKVDGQFTWIASNLAKAWSYLCENYSDYSKRIYLITDGKEEELNSNFESVVKKYSATRGDYDHLYYVDLNGTADEKTRRVLEETEGTDIGTGFHEFYTASPVFEEISYIIGKSQGLEQHFFVKGDDVDDLSFTARIASVSVLEEGSPAPNVGISPARVSFDDLSNDDDLYKYVFQVVFYNNSECPCDITVTLKGDSDKESTLVIQPSTFIIRARNKERQSLKLKNGIGWH